MTADSLSLRLTDGVPVHLGERLGEGAGGIVFAVAGVSDVAAKIVRNPSSAWDVQVRRLIAERARLPAGHVWVAWPKALLLGRDDRVRGFLMRRLHTPSTVPLTETLDAQSRAETGLRVGGRWLLRAALHLSHAVHALESAGWLAPDLSETNVWFERASARATLLDADSLLAAEGPDRLLTWTPETAAPEVLTRGADADPTGAARWALGVLCYRILLDGRHPFTGVPIEPGGVETDGTPEGHVVAGITPLRMAVRLPPPPLTPAQLPPPVDAVARRCFVEGHADPGLRPSAGEWVMALAEADDRARPCPRNARHLCDGNAPCAWCAAEESHDVEGVVFAP